MNNIEYFPEIEDESTELNFVDSDSVAINNLSSINFLLLIIEGDLHFNYLNPSLFAIIASLNLLLNFPKT
ncbi:Protein SnodProt1 [Fusarium oxysporum f. sp. albedinis]|nr:hypothetical protein HZ326_26048 [Fusarium oxysporum f. sp. albedinis]KAJ0139973.1 Protein SnodProt1 [Fusarium oxysporum f. sp. albedinis]